MNTSTPSIPTAANAASDGPFIQGLSIAAPDVTSAPATVSTVTPINQQPPTTFTLFPTLPPELRRKILKDACSVARLVDIQPVVLQVVRNADGVSASFDHSRKAFEYKTWTKAPSILYASSEARSVGLESYSLEFGTEHSTVFGRTTITIKHEPRIYINWACDVPCFFPLPSIIPLADIKKDLATRTSMTTLAIDFEYLVTRPATQASQNELMLLFGSLKLERILLFRGHIPVMGFLSVKDEEWALKAHAEVNVIRTKDLNPVMATLPDSKQKVRATEGATIGLTKILERISDPRNLQYYKKDWVAPSVEAGVLELECED